MKRSFAILVFASSVFFASVLGVYAGNQPAVQTDLEKLGMHLYKDKNLSLNQNQSCQTCHHPLAGFADRSNFLHPYDKFVSLGSDGVSLGGRNAPTSAYAGYSPILHQDENGDWYGGMFWDGRATGEPIINPNTDDPFVNPLTGEVLMDPLATQALGPPLNEKEMAMPDKQAVIDVIIGSAYYTLWKRVFGPITDVEQAYINFGIAIAAYERSADVTKFTSKYDLAPGTFTDAEKRGMDLFEKHCASCHATVAGNGSDKALFTNYGYANIGVPANPAVPSPDYGLGGDLNDESQNGKFKIPTLRNVAVSAPYSHNGGFPTLYDMVWFVNDSRDTTPDVIVNIDNRVGNIGLSETDIGDLIAFLNTLTDDY